MPPKKTKGGANVIDGVDMKEMTRDKLEQFTWRVKEELDKEREDRNYFQLERDKIRIFWEITRNQLFEARAVVRNKEREADDIRQETEEEERQHERRVKQLLWDQSGQKGELRLEGQAAIKAEQASHEAQRRRLATDCRDLKFKLVEAEQSAAEELRQVKLKHQEELSKVRSDFEERLQEIKAAAERRLQKSVVDINLATKTDLLEVEERKNKQLDDLVKMHEKAFSDLKNYYNDITVNNLSLISSLKNQMEEYQRSKERAEKAANDAATEGRKLAEPLNLALSEAAELRRQQHNHHRDREALASKSRILTALSKQHDAIKWNYDVLEQKYEKVVAERNELQERFSQAILELHQRAALKGALLEQRLQAIHKVEEKFSTKIGSNV